MPRADVTKLARSKAVQSTASHAPPAPPGSRQARQARKLELQRELERKRRIMKAEQDEYKDICCALTEVRTYSGGFTRPKNLRTASWHNGGSYVQGNKVYERPSPAAYEPRTMYLLEGRHPTIQGPGRVDYHEKHFGICKEAALPALVRRANSPNGPGEFKKPMDAARWPWDTRRKRKSVRWWGEGEDPVVLRRQALEGALSLEEVPKDAPSQSARAGLAPAELIAARGPAMPSIHARQFHTSAIAHLPDDADSFESRKNIPGSTWSRPPRPAQDAQDDVVPTYYVERKKQRDHISQRKEEEGSLMAELNAGILSEGLAAKTRVREEKIPVEVRLPDGTIAHPSGFEPPTPETDFHPVAAKVPTEDDPLVATVKQPWDDREFPVAPAEPIVLDQEKEQEWLKRVATGAAADSASVLTGVSDINAEKRVASSAKAPEFEPTSHSDRSKIATSAWDSPSKSKRRRNDPSDDVVPPFYIERKKQRNQIAERKEEEGGLMAELNAGILSEDLAAQTREREEKIPVEVTLEDGTTVHPSGFVPPTPETEFHPAAAKPPDSPKLPWTEIDSVKGTVPVKDVASAKKPGDSRGYHTSAVVRAQVVSAPLRSSPLPTVIQNALEKKGITLDQGAQASVDARRAQYKPILEQKPFWRPLLTVTVATRPLASALRRLSMRLPRGQSYYSAIEDVDRKDFSTYNARMRTLRLERIQQIADELARRLGGAYGGLPGVRLHAGQRGRGVNGEGLADPVPRELRVMKIGVGEWYPFAEEVKERFLDDAERGGYSEFIEVFGVDEWGNRTDGKKWAGNEPAKGSALMEDKFADQLDVD